MSDFIYRFMIEIKVVRNIILNNIDTHNQSSRMHRSPPRSRQNFPDSKIQRFDKSDTDISDLIIECFDRDESCQKCHLNNIDLNDQPSRMHGSPPRSHQNFSY